MTFQDYFQSYEDYFWQWEDDMEVVAISRGNTIAYRQFLLDIMDKLSDQGLPPFGALLLAVVATNPDGLEDLRFIFTIISNKKKELEKIRRDKDSSYGTSHLVKEHRDKIIDKAFRFLENVVAVFTSLSKEKKDSFSHKLLLFQTIFENCHNIVSSENSKKVLLFYNKNGNLQKYLNPTKPFIGTIFNRDFRPLSLLYDKFPDADAILKKLKGIPDITEEVPQLEDKPIQVFAKKDFVDELIAQEETFHIGSLIRHIWAGLSIPFHNTIPSQQPLGGVSDLTNKGNLDRLLISEFANDDLVFLLRLANNEALYLHREVPPAPNQLQRILLIDISLKNWGTPKTIAFALLLAIAKHPKTDISCLAYLIGREYMLIQFDTPEHIINSMQPLSDSLYAAEGLHLFFRENKKHKNQEFIWIGAEESTLSLPLQQAMEEYKHLFSYWLLTDNEGNINVYKRQHQSRKYVQHILLPLEKLWNRESTKTPKQEQEKEIVVGKYPLLFPMPYDIKNVIVTNEDEKFVINHERNLLMVLGNKKGLRLIHQNIPFTTGLFVIGKTRDNDYQLLMYNPRKQELTFINLTRKTHIKIITEWEEKKQTSLFTFYQNDFYHKQDKDMHLLRIENDKLRVTPLNDYIAFKRTLLEKFSAYEKSITQSKSVTISGFPPSASAILKNIDKVFVNETFDLVFNTHKLVKNQHGIIKLEKTNLLTRRYEAIPNASKSEFTFPNGYSVVVNRSGMIVLKGNGVFGHEEEANREKTREISDCQIFIPSVLDSSLGIGAIIGEVEEFTGNEFYHYPPLQVIKIETFWKKYIKKYIDMIIYECNDDII